MITSNKLTANAIVSAIAVPNDINILSPYIIMDLQESVEATVYRERSETGGEKSPCLCCLRFYCVHF
jgi:hypothetical protein